MCFTEIRLLRQGLIGGIFCRLQPRIAPVRGEKVHVHVRPGEHGRGQGKLRILGDGLLSNSIACGITTRVRAYWSLARLE